MLLLHIIILAIVQGLTEFLPVSSSGHLILAHDMLDHKDTMEANDILLFDIAVHVGTLFAVLLYFRQDVWVMFKGLFLRKKDGLSLFLKVVIASIPVVLAGYYIAQTSPAWLQSVEVIAWTTFIGAILLWVADKFFTRARDVEHIGYLDSVFIGLAQVLALIPGTSRSGITMTAGRFIGMSANEAARFSLLLGMVAISGAGTLSSIDLLDAENITLKTDLLWAIGLSFLAGYASIAFMMKLLEKAGFTPFVLYRLALAAALFWYVYL